MSASLPHGADVPRPLSLNHECVEVARSKTRCAIDALQRALSSLVGHEISEHDTCYAHDQLYRAGAFVAQAGATLEILKKDFDTITLESRANETLGQFIHRKMEEEGSAAKGGA